MAREMVPIFISTMALAICFAHPRDPGEVMIRLEKW